MQPLASHEEMTTSGFHPTDEELAAYIDRRLGSKDRARVTEHLAGCDRCYAVFSGVVRFQLDEKEEEMSKPVEAEVVVFDRARRRRHPWWIPTTIAAALALIGIGVGSIFWSRPMAVAKLAAPVEGREEVTTKLWKHAVYRGGLGDDQGDDWKLDTRAAVQAGALFVDFRIAASAGDSVQAHERWRQIGNAVANTLGGNDESQRFRDEATAIEKEGKLRKILASASERERYLEGEEIVEPKYFRLGKWVEAGRLAAELEEPKFFTRWANRRFLKSTLADKAMALPVEVEKDLVAIRDAWRTKDYSILAEHFQSILDYYDFKS